MITLRAMALLVLLLSPALAAEPLEKMEPIGQIVFTMQLNEIFPKEVTVEEGWYLITLRNGVITEALDLDVSEDGGAVAAAKRTNALSARTSVLVRLHGGGKRFFRVNGNQKWRAEIRIVPKKNKEEQ
jgi:hypothetical protein